MEGQRSNMAIHERGRGTFTAWKQRCSHHDTCTNHSFISLVTAVIIMNLSHSNNTIMYCVVIRNRYNNQAGASVYRNHCLK